MRFLQAWFLFACLAVGVVSSGNATTNATSAPSTSAPATTTKSPTLSPTPYVPPVYYQATARGSSTQQGGGPVEMSWVLTLDRVRNTVNFTLTGPSFGYLSLGFGSSTMLNLYTIGYFGSAQENYFNDYEECNEGGQCDIRYCGGRCLSLKSNNVVAGTRTVVLERPLGKRGVHDINFTQVFVDGECSSPSISGVWMVGDNLSPDSEHGTGLCENGPKNTCFGRGGGATFTFIDPSLALDPTTTSKFIPRTELESSGIFLTVNTNMSHMFTTMEGPSAEYWSIAWGPSMSQASGLAYSSGRAGVPCGRADKICEWWFDGIQASNCHLWTTSLWSISGVAVNAGMVTVNASRPLDALGVANRAVMTFMDPSITIIWAKKTGSIVMVNHGVSERGVVNLGYGQNTPTGTIAPPASAASNPNCASSAGGPGGGAAVNGRFIVAGGLLDFAQTLEAGNLVKLDVNGPTDRYWSIGWNHQKAINKAMDKADAVAFLGGTTFGDHYLGGYGATCCNADAVNNVPWTVVSQTITGGKVHIVATRPMVSSDPLDFTFDLATPDIALVWAVGPSAGSTGMVNHGASASTRDTIAFNIILGTGGGLAVESLSTLEEHSVLMFLAFGFMIPLAILVHRNQQADCLKKREPCGQQMHRILNTGAVMVAWAAMLVQVVVFQGFTTSLHSRAGLALVCAVTVQGIFGTLGFYNKHDLWFVHRFFGLAVAAWGLFQIYSGLVVSGRYTTTTFALYGLYVVIVVGGMIGGECCRRGDPEGKASIWIQLDRRSDVELEDLVMQREGAQPVGSTSTK